MATEKITGLSEAEEIMHDDQLPGEKEAQESNPAGGEVAP